MLVIISLKCVMALTSDLQMSEVVEEYLRVQRWNDLLHSCFS